MHLIRFTFPWQIFVLIACFHALPSGYAQPADDNASGGAAALEQSPNQVEMLRIGSPAPPLDIAHWISDRQGAFQPVTEFAPGKVYVVEFWATWCGPCVMSMPHLVATQNQLAARGVQIISVSDEDLPTVQEFLAKPFRGEAPGESENGQEGTEETNGLAPTTYGELTSAYCLTCDPDGSTQRDYMEAAGQGGIPTCFIVGKTGQIEWIGHPMEMDEPLAAVVADNWDRDAFRVQIEREQKRQMLLTNLKRKLSRAAGNGPDFDPVPLLKILEDARTQVQDDPQMLEMLDRIGVNIQMTPILEQISERNYDAADEAWALIAPTASPQQLGEMQSARIQAFLQVEEQGRAAAALNDYAAHKSAAPDALNGLAWSIAQMAGELKVSPELLTAAATAAEAALTARPNDASILDTLAHVFAAQGDTPRAIETQEKAVEAAGGDDQELRTYLEELRSGS